MPNVFICYRHDDTSGEASRLAWELGRRFGQSRIFIDHHAIPPGDDFPERIRTALDACQVALVLIGDRWLSDALPDGTRRIASMGDYVRREIAAVIDHDSVVVVSP